MSGEWREEPSRKGSQSTGTYEITVFLRIFQCSRLVKFINKIKPGVKILKIEKIIAFDKHLPELLFVILFSQ